MRKIISLSLLLSVFSLTSSVSAETLNEYCLRLSDQWSSSGDVEGGCACFVDIVSGDAELSDEFLGFETKYSNDAEAYEGSSAGIKAAYDQCDVDL